MLESFLAAPLASFFGVLGLMLAGTWPLLHGRRAMLLAQAGVAGAFTAHYLLLGALTACVLNGLIAAQALAAIPLGRDPRFRRVYLGMLPAIAAVLALTWQGVPSALSSLATAIMSLARWQVDERSFRLLMLLSAPVWGAHDFRVGSLPGMTAAAMTVATSLYGLARMRRAGGSGGAAG